MTSLAKFIEIAILAAVLWWIVQHALWLLFFL